MGYINVHDVIRKPLIKTTSHEHHYFIALHHHHHHHNSNCIPFTTTTITTTFLMFFPSTTTTTTTTFLLYSLNHHHHHISFVFPTTTTATTTFLLFSPPPPPHFYCFPTTSTIEVNVFHRGKDNSVHFILVMSPARTMPFFFFPFLSKSLNRSCYVSTSHKLEKSSFDALLITPSFEVHHGLFSFVSV